MCQWLSKRTVPTDTVPTDINLAIPKETNIKDLKKFVINKNEKILNDIIKPKEEMIKILYTENKALHKEISKQAKIVDEAEKYQKERQIIMSDNRELHNRVDELEEEYKEKSVVLEYEYKNKYHKLEKENKYLHKVIDRFKDTVGKFIKWVCKKFDLGAEDAVIRDFERETRTLLNVEKQIKKEKDLDLRL